MLASAPTYNLRAIEPAIFLTTHLVYVNMGASSTFYRWRMPKVGRWDRDPELRQLRPWPTGIRFDNTRAERIIDRRMAPQPVNALLRRALSPSSRSAICGSPTEVGFWVG